MKIERIIWTFTGVLMTVFGIYLGVLSLSDPTHGWSGLLFTVMGCGVLYVLWVEA